MPDSTPVQNDCETSADVPITCDWWLAPLHRMAHGRAGNAHSFVTQYPVAVRPAILLFLLSMPGRTDWICWL